MSNKTWNKLTVRWFLPIMGSSSYCFRLPSSCSWHLASRILPLLPVVSQPEKHFTGNNSISVINQTYKETIGYRSTTVKIAAFNHVFMTDWRQSFESQWVRRAWLPTSCSGSTEFFPAADSSQSAAPADGSRCKAGDTGISPITYDGDLQFLRSCVANSGTSRVQIPISSL